MPQAGKSYFAHQLRQVRKDQMNKPLVIYHGNCADGFTAAWLFNMWYGEQHPRIDGTMPDDWIVDHHAGAHGMPPPDSSGRDASPISAASARSCATQGSGPECHADDRHASAIRDCRTSSTRICRCIWTTRAAARG